uniref:Zinc finger C2HC domain-containing protein 1A n=1 Tax=Rhabditophanes sp. KR3021 TaxID=114890 RepID=A0AC35TJW4_9BILA
MVTETESVTTFPCSYCGRKFVKDSLEKHEAACQKISAKKRKPFDSGKQRATGSDVNYKDVKKVQIEKEKNGGVFARPKTNWKERHETFIEAVSSSKQVEIAIKTGQPLPPPPKAIVPKDYVGCEYCGRNFAEKAAERHIPFCKEQYTRKQGPVKRAPSAKPMLAPAKGQSNVSALRTREPSPLRMNPVSKPPAARRPSLERPQESAQSRQVRSTNNSATSTVVRSNLPLPSKRSTSAPRNPLLGNRNNSKPPYG